jgi:hypothetical protein
MLGRIGSAAFGLGLLAVLPRALAQNTPEPTYESQGVQEAGEQTGGEPAAREPEGADRLFPLIVAMEHALRDLIPADRFTSALNAIERAIRDLTAEDESEYRERQEARNEADLRAQQGMFWAAAASVVLTALGVWLIWKTLVYTRATVEEARKGTAAATQAAEAALEANKLNRDVFVAEQRAWVAIKNIKIASSLLWSDKQGNIAIQFAIENTGRTPAKYVWLEAGIDINGSHRAYASYRELTQRARQMGQTLGYAGERGYILFPGERITQGLGFVISEADLKAQFGDRDGWSEEIAIFPTLFGCVRYELIFGGERRQTGFIMRILRVPDASEVIAIGPAFGDIPLEQLMLHREFVGDIIAD